MDDTRATGDTMWAACDLLVSFEGQRIQWPAADGELFIGRENPPSHIQIAHPAVSRLHARLVPGAPWRLVDFDSLNGIYLDGTRVTSDLDVIDGMTVHLGHPDGVPVTFNYVTEPAWRLPQWPGADLPVPTGRDRSEDSDDDTEALTDDMRRALIKESIVVELDGVAADLALLPSTEGARRKVATNALHTRLARVDGLLSALSALGSEEAVSAFGTVRGVYARLLDQSPGGGVAA